MEITIKAWKTRNATSRELSRRTAEMLDEISQEGSGIVVIRHGEAVAMLVPLEPIRRRAPRRVSIEERDDAPFETPELDDSSRNLLAEMARSAPDPYRPTEVETATTCVRLELNGLAESDGGNYWLTADGERVAAKLTA